MINSLRHLRHTTAGKVAIGLVAASVVAVVPAVTGAFAAQTPPPPAPTITSGPSGVTTSNTATFKYTSAVSGAGFKCSLDGADLKSCATTGITYSNLANGSHTFSVVASTSGNNSSAPATRTWTIDRTAPDIAIAFPADGASLQSAAWQTACTTTGVCGTAADPRGVQSVSVAIRQASTGKFWNGTSFGSTAAVYKPATGTTSWHYAMPAPADGAYTLSVRATDGLGNMTASTTPATSAFTIDNTAPPAPFFTKTPESPTFQEDSHFSFRDAEAKVGFRCTLDGGAESDCSGSQAVFNDLDPVEHCLAVVAVDAAGNRSSPVQYCWIIAIKQNFRVTGSVPQPFHPGAERVVDLEISNPFAFDIKIHDVVITVESVTKDGSPNPACIGSDNLVTARAFTGPVVVPRKSTMTLSELGVPQSQWPILQMPNLPTNQDACKASTFNFSYSGIATHSS